MSFCRYVGDLVTDIRLQSNNADYSTSTGNSQDLFLRYINDAQDHLQAAILNVHPQEFVTEVILTSASGTEIVSVPEDVFINNRVISVEYSPTGQVRDYYKLRQKTFLERDTRSIGEPNFYIRSGNSIYLNPIPTRTASLRVLYYRELDDAAFRVAKISANATSSVTLENTVSSEDAAKLAVAEYVCISDRFGNPILRNGKVSSYNSGTRVITFVANTSTYLVGSATITNASDYLTIGQYTTTHPKLPRNAERYLITYSAKRGLQKDANSVGQIVEDSEMMRMEMDIIESFSQPTEDVLGIPIIDKSILW